MSTGTSHMNRLMLALSSAGATVWRNNTGTGWAGKSFALTPGQAYRARGGERVVLDARPLRAGLCEGSSDIVGIVPVTITPDMVGMTLGVFLAVEAKAGAGRASPVQRNFIDHVNRLGGRATVAKTAEEALALLGGMDGRRK